MDPEDKYCRQTICRKNQGLLNNIETSSCCIQVSSDSDEVLILVNVLKFQTLFSFCSQINCWLIITIIKAGIDNMFFRIANRCLVV